MRKKQNYYYILSTRVFIHIVVCTDYYCWLPFFSILDFIIQIPFIFQLFFPYSFFFALKCVVKHGHILIVSLENIYIVRDKAYRRMIQIFVKASFLFVVVPVLRREELCSNEKKARFLASSALKLRGHLYYI